MAEGGIGQPFEVAFVGDQPMHLRVRRQHHRPRLPGGEQGGMSGFLQGEVGEPVVDQINHFAGMLQLPRAGVPVQFARVGHHGGDTGLLEHRPEALELGVEELRRRIGIDNRDPAQRPPVAGFEPPLAAEHRQRLGKQGVAGHAPGIHQVSHQRQAAGVGVDLDQLRPGGREVKVVAHADAGSARRGVGGQRRAEHGDLVARVGQHAFHRRHQRDHRGAVGFGQRYADGGKEAGPFGQRLGAIDRGQRSRQRGGQGEARCHWRLRKGVHSLRSRDSPRPEPATGGAGASVPAKKAATSSNRRVRRIGGSERQTRLP